MDIISLNADSSDTNEYSNFKNRGKVEKKYGEKFENEKPLVPLLAAVERYNRPTLGSAALHGG